MWMVGCLYDGSVRPFYTTDNFILARRMFLLLLDMGYNVATNAHWEIENEQAEWV